MFEACATAGAILLDSLPAALSGGAPAPPGAALLTNVAIAEPLAMPVSDSLLLEAALSFRDGSVSLRSLAAAAPKSGKSGRRAVAATAQRLKIHCTGRFARAAAAAAAAAEDEQAGVSRLTDAKSTLLCTFVAPQMQQGESLRAPSAAAAIWVPHAAQQNGFGLQPAAADATLHLVGAFTPPPTNGERPPPLSIPVALESLALHCSRGHSYRAHPAAAPRAPAAGIAASGSAAEVAVDFVLAGSCSSTLFQLYSLRIREVAAPVAMTSATAAAATAAEATDQEEDRRFMYSIEWQMEAATSAVAPAQQAPAQLSKDGAAVVLAATSAKAGWNLSQWAPGQLEAALRLDRSAPPSAALSAAVDGLELLQKQLALLPAGSLLALAVHSSAAASALGPLPAPCAAPGTHAAQAAVQALLKVAGMEHPAVRISYTQRDAAIPAAGAGGSHAPSGDAFGVAALAGGAASRARLLRAPAPVPRTAHHLMPMPRGSLASMRMMPLRNETPGPGQVRLSVRAVGLNFR